MKIRKLLPLLVILAALLGAGAWLLFGAGEQPQGVAAVPDATASEATRGSGESKPELLTPPPAPEEPENLVDTGTTVAWPVDLELELLRPFEGPTAPGVAPRGSGRNARLTGRVQGAEGVGVPATLTFVAGLNAGRVLSANAEGWFGATDLYPGLALVRVEGPRIPGSLREVRLAQGQEARLVLAYGLPGAVGGTVFGDGEEPLEGAEVELDGQRTTTNAAGQFSFTAVAGGTDVVLVLRKEGFASLQARIGVAAGRTLPPDHYRFRLERGASLELVLPMPAGAPGPAMVVLTPATSQGVSTSAASQVRTRYAWSRLGPYEVVPGASLVLHDLPPTRVAVRVYHRGAQAKPPQAVAFLRPGHVERVEIRLDPAPRVTGRVVDARGLAVPGAEVVLEAPDRVAAGAAHLSDQPGIGVFEAELYPSLPPAFQRTTADGDGRFVLTAWEETAPARYLSATSPDGSLHGARVLQSGEQEVELRLSARELGQARLEIDFPGRFQGLPVRVSVNGELRPEVILAPRRSLSLDELARGRWRVSARWNGEPLLPGDGLRELDLEDTGYLEIPLPAGAIEGQDEDTLVRSGRRP